MANIYKGSFVNTQVDYTDNSPNEQTIYLKITDTTDSGSNLPYGLNYYADTSIGDGNQLMNVGWGPLPSGTTSLIIGYRLVGATTWTDITITSPATNGFYQWIVVYGEYEIRFQVVGVTTEIYYDFPPTVYQLEMADKPIVIQTIDNSEDKFTSIKSKSATIRVFTNQDVNAMTFSNGGDSQYKVEIGVNDETNLLFSGWLSISDLGQTFQPDPNVLVLTATDGLGFLRDLPLSDDEGRYLTGPHKLISFIAWCLQKTGLELDIWIQMNLLESAATYDDPLDHFYNYCYLNAQTFEEAIGESENCYSVLDKILGEFCELSQQKNRWFIKSIDEAGYADFRICRFTYDGTPYDYQTKTYTKNIGADETMAFMNDDARLSLQRPYKYVKQTFDYNYPTEIVQNIDFERGEVIISPNTNLATSTGTYRPEGWTLARASDGTGGIWMDLYQQTGARGEIVKNFEYAYEKDRYVIVEHEDVAGTDYIHYLKSTPFYVQKGDRLNISVDVGQDTDLTFVNPVHVWLEADSAYYAWNLDVTSLNSEGQPITNEWVAKNKPLTASISDNPFAQTWRMELDGDLDAQDDLPKFKNVSGEIDVPADGKIWVRLCTNFNIFAPYYFSNLNISITPKVNGSYQKYTGQEHLSEQDIDNKASRDVQIYMTDAPRIEMKGSLLKIKNNYNIYSGAASFVADNGVNLDGYQVPLFSLNDYVLISGSSYNNIKYRIVGISYSLIADKTILTFAETVVPEVAASILLQGYNYELTENFYDSITFSPSQIPSISYTTVNNYTIIITIGPGLVEDAIYNVEFDYDYNVPSPGYNKDISYTTPAGATLDQVVNGIAALLAGGNILCTNLGNGELEVKVESGDNRSISNIFLSVDTPNLYYPYGQHQNQAVWNQFNRVFTAFEATIDGLDTEMVDSYDLPNLPDLMHCYYQTDDHPATTNKQFKVLHYEQDTDNCEWGLYMMEVSDSTIAKTYTGHSFKYVQK